MMMAMIRVLMKKMTKTLSSLPLSLLLVGGLVRIGVADNDQKIVVVSSAEGTWGGRVVLVSASIPDTPRPFILLQRLAGLVPLGPAPLPVPRPPVVHIQGP